MLNKLFRKEFNIIVYITILLAISILILHPVIYKGYAERLGDDDWMLYNNPFIRDLDFDLIFQVFTSIYSGQYSPVNTLYYLIVHNIFGTEPFWYHLFSLLIHLFNACFVFFIIIKLLKIKEVNQIISNNNIYNISFLTAVLFAIHPMQIESIVWISASKILLYSFFFLLAIGQYIKYRETKDKKFYIITLVLFCLSFGSKEEAVVLPLCLIIIDWFLYKNYLSVRYLLSVLPFFILAGIFGIFSLYVQEQGFSDKLENNYYPTYQRVLLGCYAFSEYIIKGIVPIRLSYFYPFPMSPGEKISSWYLFYPFLIFNIIVVLYDNFYMTKNKVFVFSALFFLFNIFLSLHIIPIARGSLISDRYMYLSSIGLFFILSYLIFKYFNYKYTIYSGVVILYLLYLGIFSYNYLIEWV